jgi:hypothetical protein
MRAATTAEIFVLLSGAPETQTPADELRRAAFALNRD